MQHDERANGDPDDEREELFVPCPHCDKLTAPNRDRKGRIVATTAGLSVGAVAGGLLGSIVGIATGGTAIAGTIPVGMSLGAHLGGAGLFVGSKIDKIRCMECKTEIGFVDIVIAYKRALATAEHLAACARQAAIDARAAADAALSVASAAENARRHAAAASRAAHAAEEAVRRGMEPGHAGD